MDILVSNQPRIALLSFFGDCCCCCVWGNQQFVYIYIHIIRTCSSKGQQIGNLSFKIGY